MRYSRIAIIVMEAAVLLVLVHVLLQHFTVSGQRLYDFVYARGPVQHVILLVASVVVVMLADRFSRYRWNYVQLEKFRNGNGKPTKEIEEQLYAVGKAYREHGKATAVSRAEQFGGDQEERHRKAYENINVLAGTLPVLGLIGTMLGLSDALFKAFGSGALSDTAVRHFVTALSTAMDTTVLAMFCAIPLFGAAFIFSRREIELIGEQLKFVRRRLHISTIVVDEKGADVLHAELRRVTGKITAEAQAAYEKLLENAAGAFHERFEKAVAEVFSTLRCQDQEMFGKVATDVAHRLGQSLEQVGNKIEHHNGRLAEGMIERFGQLEKVLRNRTPEEVIVRYQHNGQAK